MNTATLRRTPVAIAAANICGMEVMRIVVVNFTGNSGKSTIVRNVLRPMFPGVKVIRVETANSSGGDTADMVISGKDFDSVTKEIYSPEGHVIVDIGSSNIDFVRASLRRLGTTHEDVDLWLVPTMVSVKMFTDSIATVEELLARGVSPEKIRVVKNKVSDVESMDGDFANLEFAMDELGVTVVDTPILDFTSYSYLDHRAGNIEDLAADTTDYREAIMAARKAGNRIELASLTDKDVQRRLARSAVANIRAVRTEIFGRAA